MFYNGRAYGVVATTIKATKIQKLKNLDMKNKDSKTDKPCAIRSVVRSAGIEWILYLLLAGLFIFFLYSLHNGMNSDSFKIWSDAPINQLTKGDILILTIFGALLSKSSCKCGK